jgi:hypothetical protein
MEFFVNTKGIGQDESWIARTDKGNCAVRALSIAFDVHYNIAWGVLYNSGRKHAQGTYISTILKATDTLCLAKGYDKQVINVQLRMRATDIAQSWNKNSQDICALLITKKHITVFKDKVLMDTFADKNFVQKIILITKTETDMATVTLVSSMTSEERRKLLFELTEKINRKSFTSDPERDKAIKLINMLSKYKASDADEIAKREEEKLNQSFKIEFKL